MSALPHGTAIVVLGPAALKLARRLREALPGAAIHGMAGRIDGADLGFRDAAAHLRTLFAAGTPIVAVCAAGIVIRALAPLLAAKGEEPPVVAVAGDGSAAVPLLGGHRGANALARAIAAAIGGVAAVTTASDLRLGIALDEPPPGWRLAEGAPLKEFAAALLAGERPSLTVEAGNADWLQPLDFTETAARRIRVTDRLVAPVMDELVYHPPVLALGVGCERGCAAAELIGLAQETLAAAGLSPRAVAAIVSVDLKADEPAVHALAGALGVPARFFPAAALARETPRLANPSEVVFAETGCWGVAEGAALAAVGDTGALLVPKRKSARATCAVARAAMPLEAAQIGRARGRLTIVGIGPGDPAWRVPAASTAIAEASDVVGYRLYLDLLGDAIAGKQLHETELGAEEERARRALDLAAEGRAVALVSSGDAGIYGLATLVFELLEREGRDEWRRLAIAVVPGVSALQAAAARVGAPLGHDFCAISLSDLLTPWAAIERRLRAAAESDFVVALYNPRSARRTDQLAAARQILLRARPAATPVVLARNLGRSDERVDVTTLVALDPASVDMLTLVLVGSSTTRAADAFVYTPRGYAAKALRTPRTAR